MWSKGEGGTHFLVNMPILLPTSHFHLQSSCDHIFIYFLKVGIYFWLYQVLVAACRKLFFFQLWHVSS